MPKTIKPARVFISFEFPVHRLAKDVILGPFLDIAFTSGGGLRAKKPGDGVDVGTLIATIGTLSAFGFFYKTVGPGSETYRSMSVYSEVP
jgi:hypothetical protein